MTPEPSMMTYPANNKEYLIKIVIGHRTGPIINHESETISM